MLRRSLLERALAALLGSAASAEVLCRHLKTLPKSGKPNSEWAASLREGLQRAVQEDVDLRTGKSNRLNEIQLQATWLCGSHFLQEPSIPVLDVVFNELMMRDDDRVMFRDEHAQRYAELVSEIDPTVVVGWHLAAGEKKAFDAARERLKATTERLDTLFVSSRFVEDEFAENHVHLGGICGDEVNLAHLVLYLGPESVAYQWSASTKKGPNWAGLDKDLAPLHVVRLRRIQRMIVGLVEIWKCSGSVHDFGPGGAEMLLVRASLQQETSACNSTQCDWATMDEGLLLRNGDTSYRWMLKQLSGAARQGKFRLGWTWLFILLWRSYRDPNVSAATRAAVLLVIVDIMVLRRELIMNGNGLRRFTTTYFAPPLRTLFMSRADWKTESKSEAVRRLFLVTGDKAELKISVRDFNHHNTQTLARIARERINLLRVAEDDGEGAQTISALANWHFCLHFNRSLDKAKSHSERRQKLWGEAKALKNVLESQEQWAITEFDGSANGKNSDQLFSPAHFVRGLDVAGDETAWPISVFAPMLRLLREDRSTSTQLGPQQASLPKLHFSIHVGEDYAHPISGLRHVDETVEFCKMRGGDRLGHALALGIAPEEWLRSHGDVLLSVDEHVDNLVWSWENARKLASGPNVKSATLVQSRIEDRIRRFLPHVSWHPGTPLDPPFEELYKAWHLRRNCAYLANCLNSSSVFILPEFKAGVPDSLELMAELGKPNMNNAARLFLLWAKRQERQIAISSGDEKVIMVRLTSQRHGGASRAQQRLEIESGPDYAGLMHDHDDNHDLEFMAALQDVYIERYAQMGLSIETNPSSNVYVGQIATYSDHPIYRWDPPNAGELTNGGKINRFGLRKISMPVTINTDDPGIVPTTLRMEYHLMREAALDRGNPVLMTDEWIDRIRKRGLDYFESTHNGKRVAT
ncbi:MULTISPECIES: hypothetical protein [Burkholderia cepacia complex]|uniref:hypothetical protein n=1 Tax=Burkholderia cepacia complex TaxID=87882 RepID=UPI000B1DEB3F|nr:MULTISPECIES: hypothetical protein [Burkholderia cepacia complex]MCO1349774.1 hypothetical protein [Burkholderia vietnamiensis]MCO1432244.1 hypothetical protein [Burkholderia vietnamiensis]UQN47586.1 hypothetical protein L0Y95_04770 [Burkholderia vietnamiensis]